MPAAPYEACEKLSTRVTSMLLVRYRANDYSVPVEWGHRALILYGVGFGPTTPAVPAGKVFSGSATTNSPVTITIGGVNANVAFAGITQAGLYQFNLTVPSAASGD